MLFSITLPILYPIEFPPVSLIIVQYKREIQKNLRTLKTILERTS